MQIGGSTFSTLPAPINRRDELSDRRYSERRQSDVTAVSEQTAQTASQRGEITRIRTRPSAESQNAGAAVYKFSDLLSSRNRAAVQAYRSNGPSIEEQLGVELAGVDVYA